MRISADVIGIGLVVVVAAALVLGAPLIFPKDPHADDVLMDQKGPMITDDGKKTLKKRL